MIEERLAIRLEEITQAIEVLASDVFPKYQIRDIQWLECFFIMVELRELLEGPNQHDD